ncbi:hypothetical protein CR513_24269, partial [Mucuna pruriens]
MGTFKSSAIMCSSGLCALEETPTIIDKPEFSKSWIIVPVFSYLLPPQAYFQTLLPSFLLKSPCFVRTALFLFRLDNLIRTSSACFKTSLRWNLQLGSYSDPRFISFAGESSRDLPGVSNQGAQPSSVATPADDTSNNEGGSSSSSDSRDDFPFRVVYRDHRSDNLADGAYSWVDPEVLRVSSLLMKSGSLLGMASTICQPRTWSVTVSACRSGEAVCMSSAKGPKPFFYLYDTLHSKLGINLPFTHFEWSVLRALNVAPTQLHPNSWAFVRAFELLCKDLGKAPTLGARRKLLRPFLESYKTFKEQFFRVAPSDPNSRFLIDREGRQYFPLQWTRQPAVSISVDVKNLESWERAFIAELKDLPVYHSADIIKGEGYSTKALAELRKRKGRNAQPPPPPADIEVETAPLSTAGIEVEAAPLSAAGPIDLPRLRKKRHRVHRWFSSLGETLLPPLDTDDRPRKRQHLDEVGVDDVSASPDTSAPHSSDPRPLLYKSFVQAADRTIASSTLEVEVERLGLAGVYGALQQYAAHGFALARVTEKRFGNVEAERSSWAEQRRGLEEENRKLSSALAEAVARLHDHRSSTAKLHETLRATQKMNGELLDTKAELLQAKTDLELGNDSLQAEVKRLESEKADMQEVHQDEMKAVEDSLKVAQDTIEAHNKTIYQQGINIVDQYEVGFHRALGQVKFLHPSIDVSEADPFKEIHDGRLVSVLTPPGSPTS